ncbi:MAG: hypothetical protein KAX09_09310 [Candidatus Heimdallarchaeota archaeon]|nr:hypothetical protein [Candidatus Heimdallarchaeota archaeon]MCK4291168.1 hypothetical protein [Candidatus Heimdallarchaeota archaeon]
MSIVTYPHFGPLTRLFKAVFQVLEVPEERIVAPSVPNKRTLDIGSEHSPEWMCTPFKLSLGSLIESLEKGANHAFQIGGIGTCRASCYGPVQRVIIEDLGFSAKFSNIDYHLPIDMLKDFKSVSNGFTFLQTVAAIRKIWVKNYSLDLTENLINFYRGVEIEKGQTDKVANEVYDKLFSIHRVREIKKYHKEIPKIFEEKIPIDEDADPLKIGVIGEIYVVLEPMLHLHLYRRLNDLGVICRNTVSLKKFTDIPAKFNPFVKEYYKVYREKARPYIQEYCGGDGQESIGATILLRELGWDGMVHIWPFSCMPELSAQAVIPVVSHDTGMPVLPMVVDEQTGETGYQTRLEAFVDMLKIKRENERAGKPPEKISWETFNYD